MNACEQAVHRYWGVSQAWRRGVGAEEYTYGSLMEEIQTITWRQDRVGTYAYTMLDEVIRDKRAEPIPAHDIAAQNNEVAELRTQEPESKVRRVIVSND